MNINEVMKLMDTINYGYLDKDGNKHIDDFDKFYDNYILQSPESLLNTKLGVCWDQVELERYLLKDLDIKTYYLVLYDNIKNPTHTFLTYKLNNKYYWFEHSWEDLKGIREYDDINSLLKDVIINFLKDYNNDISNLELKEYKKPKYNISAKEFMESMDNAKDIKIDFI